MNTTLILRSAFWLLLLGFLAWDFQHSEPVDLRNEPPLIAAQRGARLLRVHDVAETVQAVRVWRGLRDRALVG